jgi:glycosyltransferase involved in cell wall biosynthesis
MRPRLFFLLPGDPETLTGGYGYDRRMAQALRDLGWQVEVQSLSARFPDPDAAAMQGADAALAALPDGSLALIDGLALGTMPEIAQRHAARLQLLALVHHPLARETGLEPARAAQLYESERRALQAVRQVVVTSRATAAALADYAVPAQRIAVVEPGCDLAPLAPRRGRSGGIRELLCVATLTERKGHELLIEALVGLQALPWRLCCVGSLTRNPTVTARVQRLLRTRGLAGRVSLPGELAGTELQQRYLAADLFVLPTLYEGYGMVVAEALSFGLPVIATDTGAIAELLSAQAGRLLPPGDARALQATLRELLTAPGALAACAAGAERRRASLIGWPQQAQRLATVLRSVAAA